jgi:hypothetical protein
MKTQSKKSAGKFASWAIAALVVAGAAGIWAVADVSASSSLATKVFVFFISAVIVVQVVPGIMLLGAMLKGVCSMVSKKVTAGPGKK